MFSFKKAVSIISVSVLWMALFQNLILVTAEEETDGTFSDINQKCFIIDPGHGGEDGGATSVNGVFESHINLQIAHKINDFLLLTGYRSYLLRATDEDLHTGGTTIAQRKRSDLKNRVNTINATKNAVLISIHQNHFFDERCCGLQVFYSDCAESLRLAESIHSSYRSYISPNSTRKPAVGKDIYLLYKVNCPAVLVECGFISNVRESALLQTNYYQLRLSAVLFFAIIQSYTI